MATKKKPDKTEKKFPDSKFPPRKPRAKKKPGAK